MQNRHTEFNWMTKPEVARIVRITEDGWETASDMVFKFQFGTDRQRYILPAGALLVGPFEKARAKAARELVRSKKDTHQAQEAYVGALRYDGVKPSVADLIYLHWRRMLA